MANPFGPPDRLHPEAGGDLVRGVHQDAVEQRRVGAVQEDQLSDRLSVNTLLWFLKKTNIFLF